MEVHVPNEFTQDRPAIRFTTEVFDISIHEHELASQLPKVTGGPSLQPGPDTFTSFCTGPGAPATLQDYLRCDLAILGLHVTSFTDSTIVAFAWPHAIAGALGLKEVLSAWSKALRDINDVSPLLGACKNVLDGVGTDMDEQTPYGLASVQIKGWDLVKFVSRLLWTVFWNPNVESRALFLPRQFFAQLRLSCIKELEAVHGTDSAPFVSDGDVLTA
ncbi:hypothetical protein FDECE_723 [Fusarium decemcellulare]|nr:hypothetical protein FDECE_723 [Fusarium decemcellulare]